MNCHSHYNVVAAISNIVFLFCCCGYKSETESLNYGMIIVILNIGNVKQLLH